MGEIYYFLKINIHSVRKPKRHNIKKLEKKSCKTESMTLRLAKRRTSQNAGQERAIAEIRAIPETKPVQRPQILRTRKDVFPRQQG